MLRCENLMLHKTYLSLLNSLKQNHILIVLLLFMIFMAVFSLALLSRCKVFALRNKLRKFGLMSLLGGLVERIQLVLLSGFKF